MCLEIITPQTKLVQISCRYCRMNAGLWSSEWNITAPRNIRMTQLVPVRLYGPYEKEKSSISLRSSQGTDGAGNGKRQSKAKGKE
jgi:hypothetical protein